VHTALERLPSGRFDAAAEMQRALASILRGQTEPTDDKILARSVKDAIARRAPTDLD
jgi:hypothetical protein